MSGMKSAVSQKNPYYIPKERYLELKYFCMQYPTWRDAYSHLDSLSRRPDDLNLYFGKSSRYSDPVAQCVIAKQYFMDRIDCVYRAACDTSSEFCGYILRGATENLSYGELVAQMGIPCCQDVYYDLRRRFFYILSHYRDEIPDSGYRFTDYDAIKRRKEK